MYDDTIQPVYHLTRYMQNVKKKFHISWFDVILYLILAVICLLFFYPLYYIFVASLSSPLYVFNNPILVIPKDVTLYNYQMMMESESVWIGYRNTLIYVVAGTALNVVVTFITAYAMAQPYLPAKRVLSFLIVFTMFFSGGMIPTFLVVKGLGLLDSIWAIILPGAVSTWNLLITRTYLMEQIPHELNEAAEVDGAGEYRTFFQIVLPLSAPILIVITLFYASGHWNSWFNALIYLRDRDMYPLQIFLREMLIENQSVDMMSEAGSDRSLYLLTLKYAVMSISILPLMIIFPFVQKHFVKGVMIGAIKG